MKYAIWSLVVLLLVLHQDYWQWHDTTLDFGFLPRTLTYHVGISLAAVVVWLLAVRYCWPAHLEDAASDESAEAGS